MNCMLILPAPTSPLDILDLPRFVMIFLLSDLVVCICLQFLSRQIHCAFSTQSCRVVSLCQSVRMQELVNQRKNFSYILYLGVLAKFVDPFQLRFESDNRHQYRTPHELQTFLEVSGTW